MVRTLEDTTSVTVMKENQKMQQLLLSRLKQNSIGLLNFIIVRFNKVILFIECLLCRYLHYYQRYHGHDHALKFASISRTVAEQRMAARQESQRTAWIDVQFLRQAVEQVVDCRRVLKYTYALGYFLQDGTPEKQLFEHQQEMLEKNTERLHEFTEQALETIDRTQVFFR